MLTIITIAIVVPIVSTASVLAARRGLPRLVADGRGIALQTVIVMVVLLAIAGAVAAVLFARANTAIEDLEDTDTDIDLTTITTQALCESQGGTWAIVAPATTESCA